MESTEEIRKKIARLINERGLNYAGVSLAIGKNIAYIQQFVKNGSPRRLGEVERRKLAQILRVDEQELTDLPLLPPVNGAGVINSEILSLVIESVENWLDSRQAKLSPHDKADLIRLLYAKICNESMQTAAEKVKDYIDIYQELRKVN